MPGAIGGDTEVQSSLDAMLQNIVTSSAIEGEQGRSTRYRVNTDGGDTKAYGHIP
jgi:hypothetical protein